MRNQLLVNDVENVWRPDSGDFPPVQPLNIARHHGKKGRNISLHVLINPHKHIRRFGFVVWHASFNATHAMLAVRWKKD